MTVSTHSPLGCRNIRWIPMDEVGSSSPVLLELLDAFLRRACGRHFHARDQRRRHQAAFGGFKLLSCEDFWQLPPVRANAIFGNLWKPTAHSAEEQKIFGKFWDPIPADFIQRTHLLTQFMRSKDVSCLQCMLAADRHGKQT